MADPRVSFTGAIINSSVQEGEDPFVNFQTSPPTNEDNEKRHYIEVVAGTTEINRNLYQFEPRALQMLASDFKQRRTLTINHEKGYFDNTLGYGATVDAIFVDDKLYVAAYISLGKTYPKGPFGSSEELRDGIIDGFINSVSQSAWPKKAKCSVCNLAYPISYDQYSSDNVCRHFRGQQVIVEENGEKVVKTVHVIIQKAEAIELSLVQIGADRGTGITTKQINLSLNDFVDQDRFDFLFGDEEKRNELIIAHPEILPANNGGEPLQPIKPINNGGEPPQPIDNPKGEDKMSQEAIQAMQTRAETAEANAAQLSVDLTAEKGKVAVAEAEKNALEAQISALEAEKTALEAQVETSNNERDAAKTQLETANSSITEKDTEISTLKQTAAENEVVIADGIAAREEHEKNYVEAYVAAVGDDCTPEDEELQKETAKSFTIATLKKKTEGLRKSAADNYPEGKNITEEGKKPADGEQDKDKSGAPLIGV